MRSFLSLILLVTVAMPSGAAETLEQLIAAAKNEKELYFVAGPSTFGGKRGLSELESAFNKKFGLNGRILFTAGPEMNAMAARVITELKAGSKSSTDMYLGSLGQFAHLQKENALQEVNWPGIFPWITFLSAFMASKEGQSILDKHDFRSSHLVEGSRMAKHLRDYKITLQDPKELFTFYLKGGGFKLNEELTKLLKR